MFKSNDGTNWGMIIIVFSFLAVVSTIIGYNVTPQNAVIAFLLVVVFNTVVTFIKSGNSFQGIATTIGVVGTSLVAGFFISIGQALQ